jgi:outer membrane protein OmpA-like peptidoglycan-associated protein
LSGWCLPAAISAARAAGACAAVLIAICALPGPCAAAPAAVRVSAAVAPRPSALSRELDRDQALLLLRLASLPQDSGVLLLREPERLILRIPARLLFEFDSATLKHDPVAAAPLAASALLLKKRRKLGALIVGYSDSLGGPALNQTLSEQRAQQVYSALTAGGIAPARLQQRGAGASDPVAGNDTPAARFENRRIEIEFLPAGWPPLQVKPEPAATP